MAVQCRAFPACGLPFRRNERESRLKTERSVVKGGSVMKTIPTKLSQISGRICVTCCSKKKFLMDIDGLNLEKIVRNSSWWVDEVRSAVIGGLLGISIGASCLALPAIADFLSYDHAELRGKDLSGQDLRGAVFAACDCRKINLKGSNMDGTTDTFAGFEGGNLQDSSWVRAFADRVVFRGANLKNANFTDAVLSGSQFNGADITGADFTDALVDNYQRLQMCKKATGTNPVTGVSTRESLFC